MFGVCAQEQGEVDASMKEWQLKYQVSTGISIHIPVILCLLGYRDAGSSCSQVRA